MQHELVPVPRPGRVLQSSGQTETVTPWLEGSAGRDSTYWQGAAERMLKQKGE